MSKPSASPPEGSWSPIIELRQYTLHSGGREVLIELFDREFIETQEVLGMRVIGQFRDIDDPDHFVWIRGFQNMESRAKGLAAFYRGPVWAEHRAVANATMIDSDNVLLLRPARPPWGFSPSNVERPPAGTTGDGEGVVVAMICWAHPEMGADLLEEYKSDLVQDFRSEGASILGYFVTERSPNNYPDLPVREGEDFWVWFFGFPDRAGADRAIPGAELERTRTEGADIMHQLIRMTPTGRSLLTGASPDCSAALRLIRGDG